MIVGFRLRRIRRRRGEAAPVVSCEHDGLSGMFYDHNQRSWHMAEIELRTKTRTRTRGGSIPSAPCQIRFASLSRPRGGG